MSVKSNNNNKTKLWNSGKTKQFIHSTAKHSIDKSTILTKFKNANFWKQTPFFNPFFLNTKTKQRVSSVAIVHRILLSFVKIAQPWNGRSASSCCILVFDNAWRVGHQLRSWSTWSGLGFWPSFLEKASRTLSSKSNDIRPLILHIFRQCNVTQSDKSR